MKPVQKSTTSPDQLQESFQFEAEHAQTERETLKRYAETIHQQQKSWIQRLVAPSEEKELLSTFLEKQNEALKDTLEDRNKGLRIIGDAQLAFIDEVCKSLLVSARSQVQLNRSTVYMERSMALNEHLSHLNVRFAELVEQQMQNAASMSERMRKVHYRQIDDMLSRWNETYTELLDDFAAIVRQRYQE
ncbi:MAG: hypothetical protein GVY26_00950 [Bacteroidetes bacterium]|jgi:hypothetical protein|nr:hypothetical protein [Bacteroidota bacterium]